MIVGVIAALTVPTLITKYQKEQTVTRLKKVYSTLQQATNKAISDNGPMISWEIGSHYAPEAAIAFFQKYLKPYLNISKDCQNSINTGCNFQYKWLNGTTYQSFNTNYERFYLSDGTLICFYVHDYNGNSYITFYIDINGQKKPNSFGKDIFEFQYNLKDSLNPNNNGKFVPYGYYYTKQEILEDANAGCNRNSVGLSCAALIMKDGWRIADDYPW